MSPKKQLSCYVAAPFQDRHQVRQVHERLERLNVCWTSRWALTDAAADTGGIDGLRAVAAQNDADVERADVLLVLAREGAGAEMFAEARYALTLGIPVVWVGRKCLSAWRDGVTRAEDLDHALHILWERASS